MRSIKKSNYLYWAWSGAPKSYWIEMQSVLIKVRVKVFARAERFNLKGGR
jgi:hypothetical protein